MKLNPGSIVPINYNLWPKASDCVVMAMVTGSEGNWLSLCPVHFEPEAAGFMDYVVTPEMTPLKMLMVVMSEQIQPVPLTAIDANFIAGKDPARLAALALPDSVREGLLRDMYFVLSHTKPQDVFKVSRGAFLPPRSSAFKLSQKLANDWNRFVVSAWQKDLAARGLNDRAVSSLVAEIERNTNSRTALSLEMPGASDKVTPRRSKNLGGLGSSSAMCSPGRSSDELQSHQQPLETARQTLVDLLVVNGRPAEAARLADATFSEFLKLILQFFPLKSE